MDQELTRAVREDLVKAEDRTTQRRLFLRRSAVVIGGAMTLAACTSSDDDVAEAGSEGGGAAGGGGGQTADGTSLFDRILDGDTVRLGADLTFPPLQLRDADGEPGGYTVELAQMMIGELNPDATIEFVEVPFGELFGALAAGRFDMSAIGATILPSRSLQVMFAGEPLFIESNVILRNVDSAVQSLEDLNSADVTLAVLAGSAQEASARALFPEATLRSFEQQPAVQEAAVGRADAVLLGEFNVPAALEENASLATLDGPPVFADINTWFMPLGDFRMQAYVDNWLRYHTIRGTLASRWNELVGGPSREIGVASVPVYSPFLAAGQVVGEALGS